MVQQWKKELANSIAEEIKKYKVLGLVDAYKLPSRQFQEIKNKIKDKARIRIIKKRVLLKALEKAGVSEELKEEVKKVIIPGILLTNDNPFAIYKFINQNKSPTFAKAGDIAPRDIVVPAGDTGLPPGPVIGELKSAGIKAKIEGNAIVVTEDSIIVKEGEVIDEQKANILMKLNIQPMEIGINIVGMEEGGTLYRRDVLDIDEQEYIDNMKRAYLHAFNLAYNTDYYVKDIMPHKIAEAYTKALNIGVNAAILEKAVIDKLIAKAHNQMLALASSLPEEARGNIAVQQQKQQEQQAQEDTEQQSQAESKQEEKKEEKSEEEAAAGLGALFG